MDRNVEYILEVARCGGITRAAENLFITPSALSKYVIALEDQLQVKLFHRIGKSFGHEKCLRRIFLLRHLR